jgi:hypothetical protein
MHFTIATGFHELSRKVLSQKPSPQSHKPHLTYRIQQHMRYSLTCHFNTQTGHIGQYTTKQWSRPCLNDQANHGSTPSRRIFPSPNGPRPILGAPSLLFNEYRKPFLSLGIKQPECKADHLPPSTAKCGMELQPTATLPYAAWRGAYLRTGTTRPLRYKFNNRCLAGSFGEWGLNTRVNKLKI